MEEVNNLCLKYGFTWDIIGNYIKLRSKRDSWIIEIFSLNKDRIELKHLNNYGKNTAHHQGMFKSIESIFKYIDGHDNKFNTKYNKMFRIEKLLKAI